MDDLIAYVRFFGCFMLGVAGAIGYLALQSWRARRRQRVFDETVELFPSSIDVGGDTAEWLTTNQEPIRDFKRE